MHAYSNQFLIREPKHLNFRARIRFVINIGEYWLFAKDFILEDNWINEDYGRIEIARGENVQRANFLFRLIANNRAGNDNSALASSDGLLDLFSSPAFNKKRLIPSNRIPFNTIQLR